MLRTLSRSAPALLLALALGACENSPVAPDPRPASISVTPARVELAVGEQASIGAQVLDESGRVVSGATVAYTVDKPSIAFVSPSGVVTGVGAGSATVTATHGSLSATVPVTVAASARGKPASILILPPRMELFVGENGSVGAQVLDGSGIVMSGAAVLYTVDKPSVASVAPNGVVTAVSPGSATVTASHGTLSASVPVTVATETRGFLRTLDIIPTGVSLDSRNPVPTYVEFRAYNGFGQSICDRVTFSFRSDRSVATAQNRSVSASDCVFQIQPVGPGETYVVASANGVSDSVRVSVTTVGYNAFFLSTPDPSETRAGATVTYEVKVIDPSGAPVAGRRVGFEVAAGSLDASSVTTDANGVARVRWTLPTRFAESGSFFNLTFRTQLPNGMVDAESRSVTVQADTPTEITLYRRNLSTNTYELVTGSTQVSLNLTAEFAAVATDRYGNRTLVPPTYTASDPGVIQSQFRSFGSGFGGPGSPVNYTYAYQQGYVRSSTARTVTLTASFPGGPSKSIEVVFANP